MEKMQERRVMVLMEKHATRYIVIDTPEDLGKAALRVLTERNEEGYYEKEELPRDPGYLLDDIPKMPAGIQEEAKVVLSDYRKELNIVSRLNEGVDEILRVIKDKDTRRAWAALRNRSEFEYERCRLETLEEP